MNDLIQEALEQVGLMMKADRSFFLEFNDKMDRIINQFQWCGDGVKTSTLAFQKSAISSHSWLNGQLFHNNFVHAESLDDIPKDATTERTALSSNDVYSFVLIPLVENNKLIAIIGIERIRKPIKWENEYLFLFKTIGSVLIRTVQKKKIEQELLENEERYRILFENSPFAIGVHQKGKIVLVNPTCVKMLKAEQASHLIGKSAMSIVHPDYKEIATERIRQMAKTRKGVGLYREKFVCSDGEPIDVEVISNPVIYEGELAFQVVFRDISEQQHAAEQVKQSENKFRTLFEDSTDAIYITSLEGQFIDVNQSFLDLFGYKPSEIAKLNAIELYPTPGQRVAFQEDLEKYGAVKNYEITLKRKDGTQVECIETATLRRDFNGEIIGYQGIIRDITEELRSKEALLKTQKLESLGILAGGIAHDFNNLLTGVLGNASAAKQYADPDSELEQLITGIIETSEKAATLTNQLLAYSGKGKFMTELIDLSGLIKSIQHLLRVSVHKTIELQYNLSEPLPQVMIDKTQIEQVILNLVTNASEAIGETVGTILVETGTSNLDQEQLDNLYYTDVIHPGEFVFFSVEDTGKGMDNTTQRRIFDPFFSTKFQGRGLGLAAVLGIIRAHNGGVEVVSEPFKGSKFNVYLPVSPAQTSISSSEKMEEEESWKGSGLILFCDDDEILLTTVERLLKILGFDVLLANNGIEALEKLKDTPEPVDLVILDMTMPKMSGKETYIEIKKEFPKLPILLSSGYSEESVVNKFDGSKIDGFIQKPYTIGKLSSKLKSIFTNSDNSE